MSKRSTLSLKADGSLLATADGSQVLVYDGRSDAGLWRHDLEEPVRFVRFAGRLLFAITGKGSLVGFDAKTGKRVHAASFGQTPKAFVAWGTEEWAYLSMKGVQLGKGATSGAFVSVAKPTHLAVDGDGRLAIGTRTGVVHLLDGDALIAEHDVGERISGLCAHPDGGWFASAEHVIYRLGPDLGGCRAVAKANDGKVSQVVASGPLIAFRLDSDWVAMTSWGDGQPRGAWNYPAEQVGELAFGPDGTEVACSIGHGDANVIDLTTGGVRRTDPHPGRATHRWGVKVGVESEEIVAVLAGGAPEGDEEEDEELTTGEMIGCLVVALVGLACLVPCVFGGIRALLG